MKLFDHDMRSGGQKDTDTESPLFKLRQKIAQAFLDGVHLRNVKFGEHSISLSPVGAGDIIRFSDTGSTATAAEGEMYVDSVDGKIRYWDGPASAERTVGNDQQIAGEDAALGTPGGAGQVIRWDSTNNRYANAWGDQGQYVVGPSTAQVVDVTTVADVSDSLDGTYFILYDVAGSVAFWIDVDNSGTAEPSHGADRSVEITTIVTDDTANAVASAIQAVVDGDSEFSASVSTNVVTVTNADAQVVGAPSAGTSGFTAAVTTEGDGPYPYSTIEAAVVAIDALGLGGMDLGRTIWVNGPHTEGASINIDEALQLTGAGKETTVYMEANTLTISSSVGTSPNRNVVVENIQFLFDNTGAISITGSDDVIFRNCRFVSTGGTVNLTVTGSGDVTFEDCEIYLSSVDFSGGSGDAKFEQTFVGTSIVGPEDSGMDFIQASVTGSITLTVNAGTPTMTVSDSALNGGTIALLGGSLTARRSVISDPITGTNQVTLQHCHVNSASGAQIAMTGSGSVLAYHTFFQASAAAVISAVDGTHNLDHCTFSSSAAGAIIDLTAATGAATHSIRNCAFEHTVASQDAIDTDTAGGLQTFDINGTTFDLNGGDQFNGTETTHWAVSYLDGRINAYALQGVDVDPTLSPGDGEALVYSSANGQYESSSSLPTSSTIADTINNQDTSGTGTLLGTGGTNGVDLTVALSDGSAETTSSSWIFQNGNEEAVWTLDGGAGSTITDASLTISSNLDTYTNNALDVNFGEGISVDTTGTQIDIGLTAGFITAAGAMAITTTAGTIQIQPTTTLQLTPTTDLIMNAGSEISFQDAYTSGSTYGSSNMPFADSIAEWSAFQAAFGAVSLLNGLEQASDWLVSQGATPVDITGNVTWDLEGAGQTFTFRDDAEAALFTITEGSAGGTTDITIESGVDTFTVDAPSFDVNSTTVDFAEGATFDSAGTAINVGTTAGQIDSGSALTIATTAGDADIILNPDGTGAVSVSNAVIEDVATPVASTDAVNKAYADSLASGLDPKESVRLATTTSIDGVYNSSGGTGGTGEFTEVDLTSSAIFDGVPVTLVADDRILIKDQDNQVQVETVQTLAKASISNNDFFWLFSATTSYYFWFDVDGGGSDPAPSAPSGAPATTSGHEVDIQGDTTADDVASTLQGVIDGQAAFSASVLTDTVTVTQSSDGSRKNAEDGTNATGFTFGVTTPGSRREENGIYVVTTAGAAGVIERAPDQDGTPSNEVSGGNFTFVEQGDTLAATGWVVQGDGELTLNTDELVWIQFSAAGAFTAGNGIDITGTVISVDESDNFVWTGTHEFDSTVDFDGAVTFTGTIAGDAGGTSDQIQIAAGTDLVMLDNDNFIPDTDDQGFVGTSSLRFKEVNAVTVVSGDHVFNHPTNGAKYRMTEHPTDGLLLKNENTGKWYRLPMIEIDAPEGE